MNFKLHNGLANFGMKFGIFWQKFCEIDCDIMGSKIFQTTKAFLPAMVERNHGHVVSIASVAGLLGVAGLCDYSSSKFGAYGFNESLQMELAATGKHDVHTTVVCPFYINTGMFDGVKTR